jgi:hypothetical protein
VDEVQYDSNSEFFDGETIVVNYVSGFSTERINVRLDEDQLSQQTGRNVVDAFQLDVTSRDSYVRYGTRDIGLRRIYKIDAVKEKGFKSVDGAKNWINGNCQDLNSDGEAETTIKERLTLLGFRYDAYCVRWNGWYGRTAALTSGDKIFETDWELSADGKRTQTVTISNSNAGRSTYKLGDHAVITNLGQLDSGVSPPSTSNVYVLHSNSFEDGWRVISRDRYQSWNRYIRNELNNDINSWARGELVGGESTLESSANSRGESAAEPFTEAEITSDLSVEDTSFSGGTFQYDTSEVLGFPAFNVYIEAGPDGYVTVEKPVGDAEVVSTSSTEVGGEADPGYVDVQFQNVADYEGSFQGTISCESPFTSDAIDARDTVGAGDVSQFRFRVSFSSTSTDSREITRDCSVDITNAEGDTVSTDVSITGVQDTECTEGNEGPKMLVASQSGLEFASGALN